MKSLGKVKRTIIAVFAMAAVLLARDVAVRATGVTEPLPVSEGSEEVTGAESVSEEVPQDPGPDPGEASSDDAQDPGQDDPGQETVPTDVPTESAQPEPEPQPGTEDTPPVTEPEESVTAEESTTEAPTETEPEPVPGIELNGPDVKAKTYCVINAKTNEILISKDPHKKMFPASTTKVMTALLVLENIEDLSQKLTFSPSSVRIDPSSSTLNPKASAGEVMTVRDALYGMLLSSANECGAMLGEFVAGSEEAFAQMMNERAKKLGAVNTHFVNAYGIHDDEHYTTAYDLCLILAEAMRNERYRQLNRTVEYHIPKTNMCGERVCIMGHSMINGTIKTDGVIGGKTGSTPQAGRTLLTAVDRDGLYTVSSLMGSDQQNFYKDEQVLLEFTYGFHNQQIPPVEWVETNDYVTAQGTVRLRYSPSILGAEYGHFDEGDTLLRLGIYGEWSKLLVEGAGEFYAYSEYLKSLQPEKVPVTTAYVWPTPPPTTTPKPTEAPTEKTTKASGKGNVTSSAPGQSADEGEDPAEDSKINALMIAVPAAMILAAAGLWLYVYLKRRNRRRRRRRHNRQ